MCSPGSLKLLEKQNNYQRVGKKNGLKNSNQAKRSLEGVGIDKVFRQKRSRSPEWSFEKPIFGLRAAAKIFLWAKLGNGVTWLVNKSQMAPVAFTPASMKQTPDQGGSRSHPKPRDQAD